jgi:ABC-type nitrate/sulfonate/bicarbonate transport system substrate-binding protein
VKPGPDATRAIAVLVVGVLAIAGVGVGYLTHTMAAGPIGGDPIVLGTAVSLPSAPVWVAADRGLYQRHGLNVTLQEYGSGLAAAAAAGRGEVDLAVSPEFDLVLTALGNGSLRGIGSVARSKRLYLVGRCDRGAGTTSGIRGWRVGVPRHTIGEFYLSRFAALQGRPLDGATLIDVGCPEGVEALCNGSLDAVVTAEPCVSAIRGRLGNTVSVLPVQGGQYTYAVIVGRDAWLADRPSETDRFMRAVREAGDWMQGHPEDAKRILQIRYGMDSPQLDAEWPGHQFSLSLDRDLLLAMEDEGRWMIENNLTDAETEPEYREMLSTGCLERVSPGSVDLPARGPP